MQLDLRITLQMDGNTSSIRTKVSHLGLISSKQEQAAVVVNLGQRGPSSTKHAAKQIGASFSLKGTQNLLLKF